MAMKLYVSYSKKSIENREKLLQIKKNREEVSNLYKKYSDRPVKSVSIPKKVQTPRIDPKKATTKQEYVSGRLFSKYFTLFEVTCGGEIMWTAGEERIDIIARDGTVLKSIPLTGSTVTAMAQSNDFVWAGFQDGSVRVFNKYSFICALEENRQSNGITCLTSGMRGAFYSASHDGTVVEWATEKDSIHYTTTLRPTTQSLTKIVSYGFRLFAVVADRLLHEYDAEDGSLVRIFETNGSKITHMVCNNGFLFTLHGGKLLVWNINNGTCIKEIHNTRSTSKFVSAFNDPINEQIMVVSDISEISFYSCNPADNFAFISKTDALEHKGEISLQAVPFMHKLKVLVCYRDGQNHFYVRRKDILSREIARAHKAFTEKYQAAVQESEEALNAQSGEYTKQANILQSLSTVCHSKMYAHLRQQLYLHLHRLVQVLRKANKMEKLAQVLRLRTCRTLIRRHFFILTRKTLDVKRAFIRKVKMVQISRMTTLGQRIAYWNALKDKAHHHTQSSK